MKKKVLYVITKSNWGGAQRYVFDLATSLPKDEFGVAVAFGGDGLLAQKLQAASVMIYHIKSIGRDVSLGKDIKSFFEFYKLFKKEQPDVVHLNSSKAAGLGALAARSASWRSGIPIKIIFTAHGWPFWETRNPLSRALIWLASWLTALLSHKVIVISDYDRRIARRMPFVGDKAIRIYNGINQNMTFDSGEQIRSAFPPGAHVTGTIGELNKNKNQQTLIEQAKNNPTMFVAIVGEGEQRVVLETKIKEANLADRVKLFGFIPAQEALKGFDIFALPSLKEGLPYVLLEARLAGLPIVANRVGGVGEILDAKSVEDFSLKQMLAKTTALYLS